MVKVQRGGEVEYSRNIPRVWISHRVQLPVLRHIRIDIDTWSRNADCARLDKLKFELIRHGMYCQYFCYHGIT